MNAENNGLGSSDLDRVEETGSMVALRDYTESGFENDVFGSLVRKARLSLARDEQRKKIEIAEFEKRQSEYNEKLRIANEALSKAKIAYEERKRIFEEKLLSWSDQKRQAESEDSSIVEENAVLTQAYLKELGRKFRTEILGNKDNLEKLKISHEGIFSKVMKSEFLTHLLSNTSQIVNNIRAHGSFKTFEEVLSSVFYNNFFNNLDEVRAFGSLRLEDCSSYIFNNFYFLLSEIKDILFADFGEQAVGEDKLFSRLELGRCYIKRHQGIPYSISLGPEFFNNISGVIKDYRIDNPIVKKQIDALVSNLEFKCLLAFLERPLESFTDIDCRDEDVCYGLVCEIVRLLINDEKIGIEFPDRPVLKEYTAILSVPEKPVFDEPEPEISDFLKVEEPIFEPTDYLRDVKKYPDFSKLKLLLNMMKVHILRNHLNEQFNVVLGLVEAASKSDNGDSHELVDVRDIKRKIDQLSVFFRKSRTKAIVDDFAKALGVEENEGFDAFLIGLLEMIKLNAFILTKGRVLFNQGANEQQKSEGRLLIYMAGQLTEKIESIAVGIESFLVSRKFQSGEISKENIALLSKFFDEKSFSDLNLLLRELDDSISISREVDGIGGVRGELRRFDEKLAAGQLPALSGQKDEEDF
ncbi:MAG: hypothetical protein RBS56_01380 [Candidatus Gracilibacteria bacterium]|jgi:hypothetical protein|nr:hypothetical protein [Candidatus Gracilibacteria bacterium]